MKRSAVICLLSVLIASGCSRHEAQESSIAPVQPSAAAWRPGPPNRAALIRDRHLPNVELITHEGRRVRFYDDLVKGKIVAINFMYARCRGTCSPATANLAQAQKSLRERMEQEVTFLSLSLDSDHDTPDVLKAYARNHGAGPGWYFLTGKRENIELLRRKLGAYELDPVIDADITQHAGIVILGNEPKGRWKAISSLSKPVRIRQAIERTILPPSEWPTGAAVIAEVPMEKSAASWKLIEPVDHSRLQFAPR
jgi:protein SCO1/2